MPCEAPQPVRPINSAPCNVSPICPNNLCGFTRRPKTCVEGVQLTPFAEVMFLTGAAPTRSAICQTLNDNRSLCQMAQNRGLYISSGVGGECTKDCNTVLKSLQIGLGGEPSSGHKIVAEIIDERGGSLSAWFKKLINPRVNPKEVYKMVCRFGWVTKGGGVGKGQGCAQASSNGGMSLVSSGLIYVMPRDMNIKFEGGRIKFDLEGTDAMGWLSQSREGPIYGTERNMVTLGSAIRDFATAKGITIDKYEFNANGTTTTMKFKPPGGTATDEGPLGVWSADNNNILGTLQEWVRFVRTSKDKGIFVTSDASCSNQRFILWEDPANGLCDEPDKCRPERVMNHYIVNGGNCSPVLSFTPQIAWNFQATGSTVRTTAGNRSPAPSNRCPAFGTGPELHIGINRNALNMFGPLGHAEGMRRATEAHLAANRTQFPIEAELKVQGDPSINSQLCFVNRYISLVVYGAYYADNPYFDDCPSWTGLNNTFLEGSPCVDFLSSPDWLITGVDHSIRDGAFHTSYKLRLIRQSAQQPVKT